MRIYVYVYAKVHATVTDGHSRIIFSLCQCSMKRTRKISNTNKISISFYVVLCQFMHIYGSRTNNVAQRAIITWSI